MAINLSTLARVSAVAALRSNGVKGVAAGDTPDDLSGTSFPASEVGLTATAGSVDAAMVSSGGTDIFRAEGPAIDNASSAAGSTTVAPFVPGATLNSIELNGATIQAAAGNNSVLPAVAINPSETPVVETTAQTSVVAVPAAVAATLDVSRAVTANDALASFADPAQQTKTAGGNASASVGTAAPVLSPTHTSIVSTPGSGLVFNISYDSSVNTAPSGFVADITAVAQYLESQFTDAVTINIDVGYGEVNGQALASNALGESISYLQSSSYSEIRTALAADAETADDATAVASLGASDPTNGGAYWLTTADAKALGVPAASSPVDGYVGFGSAANLFDYNNASGVTPGQYDFFGTVAHEITEVMGRQMMDGGIFQGASSYQPLDLFHYSAPGVRSFTGTLPGYFSIDGGVTNLDNFNTTPPGDFGDWAASAGNDSFLAYSNSGVVNAVSPTDLRELDILGWDRFQGQPPAVTIGLAFDTGLSSTDKITSDPEVTGSGAANAVVHFTVDGVAIAATTTADSLGAWFYTPIGLADGVHAIVASETGLGGTTGSASLTFTLDTTPPAVTESLADDTGISPSDRITSDPALTGSGDPNAVVHFTIDGAPIAATATADAVGAWSFTPSNLADGPHTVIASETDLAGNTGSTSLTFVLDRTAPTVKSVTSSLAHAIAGIGQTIRLTVTMSEPVFVAGGAPSLVLNDGGTGTYDAVATAALNDPSKLVFDYVVGSGDSNTTALAVIGCRPNGATVQDDAGNNADFTAAVASFPTLQISTSTTPALVAGGSVLDGPAGIGAFVPPAIAGLSNGNSVLAWVADNPQTGHFDLQLGLLDPSGNVIASMQVPGIGIDASPALAARAGGGVAVVWTQLDAGGLADEREMAFDAAGNMVSNLTSPIGLVGSTATSLAPVPGGGFVGTYETKVVGSGGVETDSVYAALFGNDGGFIASKLLGQLSTPSGLIEHPNVIALASGGYVATWAQYQVPGVTGEQAVAQLYDSNGAPSGTPFVFATLPGTAGAADKYSVAALGNGDFVAVWLDSSGAVLGQLYDAGGTALGSNFQVAGAYAGGNDASVSVAPLSTGGFAVGWIGVDQVTGLNEVLLQTFGGDGSKVGGAVAQDIAAGAPNANVVVSALADGGAALTWTDTNIHARLLAPGPGGDLTISGNAKLELYGASTASVVFAAGSTGTLKLDASTQFAGSVAGLALGNDLDLADIGFGGTTTLGYTPNNGNTGGALSVTDGSHIANIALLGSYMASSFVTASDGHGGTLVTDPPPNQQQILSHPLA